MAVLVPAAGLVLGAAPMSAPVARALTSDGQTDVAERLGRLPLSFIENQGQARPPDN